MNGIYKVHIYIQGAPRRPPYDGFVRVKADDEYQARKKAIRELRMGSFSDVPESSMRVKGIEYR